MGRPSATTRPTQPFILYGLQMSSELESDVCYRVRLAPSGESYRYNRMQAWRKVMAAYRRVDGLKSPAG